MPSLANDIELIVDIPRGEPVDDYLQRASSVVTRFDAFQRDLAGPLYEDYVFYKKMDIDEGGFAEEDFEAHPSVDRPEDIRRVLKPYRFWLGRTIDKHHGNAYMLMHVDWPNPHFFQVFVQLGSESWQHMHTELVG